MGTAVWEFLWCIDKTTKEYVNDYGEARGVILGGKPIKAEEIGEDLGEHPETVKKNLRKLQKYGYIDLKRTPYGHVIEVRKSKKFTKRQSEMTLSGQRKNALSDERESENALSPGKNASSGQSQNALSNKTLQLDNTEDYEDRKIDGGSDPLPGESDGIPSSGGTVPQEISRSPIYRIERHLAGRMNSISIPNKDFQRIQTLLKKGIPEETIIAGIDRSFDHFQPSYDGERIRSINFCIPEIEKMHKANQERRRATEGIAAVGCTTNQRPKPQRGNLSPAKVEILEKLRKAGLK